MSVNVLDKLFKPKNIALIGASNRPMSVGSVIMKNLLEGGFKGNIFAVNPKGELIHGLQSYKNIAELPETPDLAVLAIRPSLVPETLKQLAEKGTKAVIIIAAGLNVKDEGMDKTHQEIALEIARKNGMRLMGPNCLGLLVPHLGINASFSCSPAAEGHIAFVSQSGALCVSVLDWAKPKNIGFSYFASIGDAADLNFDDMLEYLADDPKTNAIFMYVESIKNRAAFMKAALAASKKKPVFAIKSGRVPEGAAAAASHTGALAGGDDVYDAAFLRAGVVRLEDLEDMYAAILFLEYRNKVQNENLTILTNGGGPGVLAVDGLIKAGGKLTKISDETKKKLDEVLPSTWSHSNPVDIIGDAPGERYAAALKILLEAPEVGEILVMYVPTGISSGSEVAEKVLEVEDKYKSRRIFGCWVGGDVVMPGIKMFNDKRLPCFESGERGVKGFMYLNDFYKLRAQRDDMDNEKIALKPVNTQKVRQIFDAVLAEGRSILTEVEAKQVFEAYAIPVVKTRIAKNPLEAKQIAAEINNTVALKILSNDISHKSDAGGVSLNLKTPEEVEIAANEMWNKISKNFPNAKLDGFTVQEMVIKKNPHEVIVGITTDPIFGPVIMVGQGGTAVELIKDTSIALPPLNTKQALDAVARTKIFKLMLGYRDRNPADINSLIETMMQIGKLIVDFEEVAELDANPLFVDENGAIAVDARIVVKKYDTSKHRLAMI